jgi:hypothetical protein
MPNSQHFPSNGSLPLPLNEDQTEEYEHVSTKKSKKKKLKIGHPNRGGKMSIFSFEKVRKSKAEHKPDIDFVIIFRFMNNADYEQFLR